MATRNLSPTIKAGALFPKMAHSSFIEVTGSRYRNLCARMKAKGLPPPPFTLYELRVDMLRVMGGDEDGLIECRYCHRFFTLKEIALDHAMPLSRAGSLGLDNIDYPCAADNDRKGSMTVDEYLALLAFLDTQNPLMRQDVLSRLEKANALAAGARRAQILAAKLEQKEANSQPAPPMRSAQAELDNF
jgi:5-methylcytosine-specific restriction endonuclease McrA